jgi:hypothetical protein
MCVHSPTQTPGRHIHITLAFWAPDPVGDAALKVRLGMSSALYSNSRDLRGWNPRAGLVRTLALKSNYSRLALEDIILVPSSQKVNTCTPLTFTEKLLLVKALTLYLGPRSN